MENREENNQEGRQGAAQLGADHPIPKGLRAASASAVTKLDATEAATQQMAGGSQVSRVRPGHWDTTEGFNVTEKQEI